MSQIGIPSSAKQEDEAMPDSVAAGVEAAPEPASVPDAGQLAAFVAEQTLAGASKAAIVQKLTDMGVDRFDAVPLVDKVYAEVTQVVEEQKPTLASLAPALLGGALAAIVAGIAWAAVTVVTDREFGALAIGVGAAVGYAVKVLARGKAGLPLQAAAALFSVLGIAIGKYGTMYWVVRSMLIEDYGAAAAGAIGPFDPDFLQFFIENVSSMLSGYDLLWVGLAVYTAWRIPQAISLKAPKQKDTVT